MSIKYVLGVTAVCLLAYYIFHFLNASFLESDFKVIDLYSPASKEKIYLKKESRGLNYTVAVISTSPKKGFTPNPDQEYVFSADDAKFYYKLQNDTLFVYTYIFRKPQIIFHLRFM